MELTLVVALFILYHLVPVWLGRTVLHHVGEAVLLGSMHLLLAFCFLLNAQGHDGRRVPPAGLLWWLLHKMELVAMQGWILLHSCVTSVTEMTGTPGAHCHDG